MIATDPLSLLFIGCFLGGLLFTLILAFVGQGHGIAHHGVHLDVSHAHAVPTGHAGPLPSVSGVHTGTHTPIGHVPHAGVPATPAAHTGQTNVHPTSGSVQQASMHAFLALLNPLNIVLFLLGFGFFGYVFHNTTHFGLPLLLTLSLLCGLVVALALIMLLNRTFGNKSAVTVQDVSDRTGLLGKVSITIPANGVGEILYVSPGGLRKSIPARSITGERFERDQEVVVVTYQRGVAEVDTWEHFVNMEESGNAPATSEDEQATLNALLKDTQRTDLDYALRKDFQKE